MRIFPKMANLKLENIRNLNPQSSNNHVHVNVLADVSIQAQKKVLRSVARNKNNNCIFAFT